jgi:hypothetical protein
VAHKHHPLGGRRQRCQRHGRACGRAARRLPREDCGDADLQCDRGAAAGGSTRAWGFEGASPWAKADPALALFPYTWQPSPPTPWPRPFPTSTRPQGSLGFTIVPPDSLSGYGGGDGTICTDPSSAACTDNAGSGPTSYGVPVKSLVQRDANGAVSGRAADVFLAQAGDGMSTAEDLAALQDFIRDGGGVILGAQAWCAHTCTRGAGAAGARRGRKEASLGGVLVQACR